MWSPKTRKSKSLHICARAVNHSDGKRAITCAKVNQVRESCVCTFCCGWQFSSVLDWGHKSSYNQNPPASTKASNFFIIAMSNKFFPLISFSLPPTVFNLFEHNGNRYLSRTQFPPNQLSRNVLLQFLPHYTVCVTITSLLRRMPKKIEGDTA